MDVRSWASEVIASFQAMQADTVISLLFATRLRPTSDSDIRRASSEVCNGLPDSWCLFLSSHAAFLTSSDTRLERLTASLAQFALVFQEQLQGDWSLPVMYRYIRRVFGLIPLGQTLKSVKRLEAVVNEFQKLLGICQRTSEKPPHSKIMGLVCVMNMLFRLYFRMNNLQLCVNLLKIINSPYSTLPSVENFSKSQQVEFRYYEGRLCIYEQQILPAEECLSFSFSHCHKSAMRNKRIILQYLIPVKAACGKFPLKSLLLKYDQMDYFPLLEAIKQGNIAAFQAELERNHDLFVQAGILIMMQNLILLAYRNLFKKTYQILCQSQIHLESFLVALSCVGDSVTKDELECLLANLIEKGWIKGYISHEKGILVLRKVSPFPRIQES